MPDLTIGRLGETTLDSPLLHKAGALKWIEDGPQVPFDPARRVDETGGEAFERAGPRRRIFFDPAHVRAAVVTCGGLCPGLNDVIRALVLELTHAYGVGEVLGIRYGYAGLNPSVGEEPWTLTPERIEDIHRQGGTILGSSRGRQPSDVAVDRLEALGVNLLFCIGGDGTLRGAHDLNEEIARRGRPIAVVGIPKTIDNDIALVYRSFGLKTAVAVADRALDCAHVEARGARHGVGLVKLMGRDSGFIAAQATLANGDVNYCLVPEIPLTLEGPHGLLAHLRQRLRARRHAVIAVAEGAGRDLVGDSGGRDASGNIRYNDIGLFLKDAIVTAFDEWGEEVHVKYFDPSYLIRSVPASSDDSIFCADLARHAAHAAMAGKTGLLIGYWHGVFTHVPLAAVAGLRKGINPSGGLWRAVVATTGQPAGWNAE